MQLTSSLLVYAGFSNFWMVWGCMSCRAQTHRSHTLWQPSWGFSSIVQAAHSPSPYCCSQPSSAPGHCSPRSPAPLSLAVHRAWVAQSPPWPPIPLPQPAPRSRLGSRSQKRMGKPTALSCHSSRGYTRSGGQVGAHRPHINLPWPHTVCRLPVGQLWDKEWHIWTIKCLACKVHLKATKNASLLTSSYIKYVQHTNCSFLFKALLEENHQFHLKIYPLQLQLDRHQLNQAQINGFI